MFVRDIHLKQFRNYRALRCPFEGRYNLLLGNNGQGKTNLLEAIYLCVHLRSFRSNSWRPLVQEGFDYFNAKILFGGSNEGLPQTHEVFVCGHKNKPQKDRVLFDKKPIRSGAMKPHQLNMLLLTNEDVLIARASPQARRRYFDHVLGLIKPEYADTLSSFYRVLLHRNAALRSGRSPSTWDEGFAELAATLINARRSFLRVIHRFLNKLFGELSGLGASASIEYASTTQSPKNFVASEEILDLLAQSANEERRCKTTQKGPHRDDYVFWIGRRSVARQASQGEMRLFAYALKLAIFEYIGSLSKRAPLLLLDDVFSDLDPNTIGLFFRTIRRSSQVFLACANKNLIPRTILPLNVYRIHDGCLRLETRVA